MGTLTGSGTTEDPFVLCTAQQWADLAGSTEPETWQQSYVLGADLQFSQVGEAQRPIGEFGRPFTGSFDGRGHAIVGLRVAAGPMSERGAFGILAGSAEASVVRNVVLIDAVVEGETNVGLLAGSLRSGIVERVSAQGSVRGIGGNKVGGLIGFIDGVEAVVQDSFIDVALEVEGGANHGGLVGLSEGIVRNCYATGTVRTNVQSVGGLVGLVTTDATVTASFAACDILAQGGAPVVVDPLFGTNDSVATSDNFYDSSAQCLMDGVPCTGGGNGRPSEYFYNPDNVPLLRWDFDTVWRARVDALPVLRVPAAL